MSTVPQSFEAVHASKWDDAVPAGVTLTPAGWDDEAWWAEVSAAMASVPVVPEPHTDRAWLLGEAGEFDARAAAAERPHERGLFRLVAWELRDLASTLRCLGFDSARGACRSPHTCLPDDPGASCRLPRPGSRRSPVAAALDVHAAWYLHLDAPAADLAAWSLLFTADRAEELEADTVEEFVREDAQYRMALRNACEDAGQEF